MALALLHLRVEESGRGGGVGAHGGGGGGSILSCCCCDGFGGRGGGGPGSSVYSSKPARWPVLAAPVACLRTLLRAACVPVSCALPPLLLLLGGATLDPRDHALGRLLAQWLRCEPMLKARPI